MKYLLITIAMILLGACDNRPIDIKVRVENTTDTVRVDRVVHDTVYLSKSSLKKDPSIQAVVALKNLDNKTYRQVYTAYEYSRFAYKCRGESPVIVQQRSARWSKRKTVEGVSFAMGLDSTTKLPIPLGSVFGNDTLGDGLYATVRDSVLQCTQVSKGMIVKAWDLSRSGKITRY